MLHKVQEVGVEEGGAAVAVTHVEHGDGVGRHMDTRPPAFVSGLNYQYVVIGSESLLLSFVDFLPIWGPRLIHEGSYLGKSCVEHSYLHAASSDTLPKLSPVPSRQQKGLASTLGERRGESGLSRSQAKLGDVLAALPQLACWETGGAGCQMCWMPDRGRVQSSACMRSTTAGSACSCSAEAYAARLCTALRSTCVGL